MNRNGMGRASAAATVLALATPLALAAGPDAVATQTTVARTAVRIGPAELIATDSKGGGLLVTELLSDRRGHAAFMWKAHNWHVSVVRRSLSGTWRLSDLGEGHWPDAAMGGRGRMVVTWWRADRREVVARRSVGAGWGPTAVLYRTPHGSNRRAGDPEVALNQRGDAFVTWWSGTAYDFFDRAAGREAPPTSAAARTRSGMRAVVRPYGGAWSPAEWMPLRGRLVAPFVDLDGRASPLRVTGGQLSTLTRLSAGSWQADPGVALQGSRVREAVGSAEGSFVASAMQPTANDTWLVQAVQKQGSAGWLPPVTVAESSQSRYRLPVGLDASGHAAIAFTDLAGAPAAVTRNPGGAWAAPVSFAGHADNLSALRVAVGPHGAVAVVWRQGGSLWAAYRSGAHATWSDPVRLSRKRDPGRGVGRPDVASLGDGTFLAEWCTGTTRTTYFLARTIGD